MDFSGSTQKHVNYHVNIWVGHYMLKMAVTQQEAESWDEEYPISEEPICVNQFADAVEADREVMPTAAVEAAVEYQEESSSESLTLITGQPFVWRKASEPKLHGQFSDDKHESEDNANHQQETDIQRPYSNLDEEDREEEDDEITSEITYAGVLEYS